MHSLSEMKTRFIGVILGTLAIGAWGEQGHDGGSEVVPQGSGAGE